MNMDHGVRMSAAHVNSARDGVAVAVRMLRAGVALCLFSVVLSACEGSNAFEPCDPDGDTPHTPCQPTRS